MRVIVKAKPAARENRVEQIDVTNYVVSVTAPPVQGRANAAIIALLADHFSVPKASVRIIQGWTSRIKSVDID